MMLSPRNVVHIAAGAVNANVVGPRFDCCRIVIGGIDWPVNTYITR
jgi:hypothetical protein